MNPVEFLSEVAAWIERGGDPGRFGHVCDELTVLMDTAGLAAHTVDAHNGAIDLLTEYIDLHMPDIADIEALVERFKDDPTAFVRALRRATRRG